MNETSQTWVGSLGVLGTLKKYEAGETIFFQNEYAKIVGFISSGRAVARVYSKQGQETWIGGFYVGDFLGHAALLTNTPIGFEVTASVETQVLQIPVPEFQNLLSANTELAEAVARDLALRLNMMTTRLVEAITLSAPGRVCAELMRLSTRVGVEPMMSIVRPNPIFSELALRVSSTRETVSRTVSDLVKDGVLKRETGALLILQPEELKLRIK